MTNARRKKHIKKPITKSITESLAELRKAQKEVEETFRRLNMKP